MGVRPSYFVNETAAIAMVARAMQASASALTPQLNVTYGALTASACVRAVPLEVPLHFIYLRTQAGLVLESAGAQRHDGAFGGGHVGKGLCDVFARRRIDGTLKAARLCVRHLQLGCHGPDPFRSAIGKRHEPQERIGR